jgi:polyferredoxin
VLRPRVLVYAALLTIVLGALFVSISNRIPVALDVMRDRNSLYRETAEGRIENVYKLQILNMDERDHRYRLAVSGIDGARLEFDTQRIEVRAGETLTLSARVNAEEDDLERQSSEIGFSIEAEDNPDIATVESARFLGPGPL